MPARANDAEANEARAPALTAARQFYADELSFTARMTSSALRNAFAKVPRERFVGPGPWRVVSTWAFGTYWTTESDDPRHVYHDVLIALDEARGINNGHPSFWAFLIGQLFVSPGERIVHLGCGTGYYTAILAELVGPQGSVRAIERDRVLGEKASEALAPWSQATVEIADGASIPLGSADAIVASAGATGPLPAWLDALDLSGRLLLPVTSGEGPGAMLLVTRQDETNFVARILCGAAFIDFAGARDPAVGARLAQAYRKDFGRGVRSLRRDPHDADDSCWLHADSWCLSRRDAAARRV